MSKTNIILGSLLIIIFGLVAYIIFSKPNKVIEPFNETKLRLQIARQDSLTIHWQKESEAWQLAANIAENKVDSLEQLKQDINEDHDQDIQFNATATIMQLDSVIRSNW